MRVRTFAVRSVPAAVAGVPWQAFQGRVAGRASCFRELACLAPRNSAAPSLRTALGHEAAWRFGRGRARISPRKFPGSAVPKSKKFSRASKPRPRLNGRGSWCEASAVLQGSGRASSRDDASARPPRGAVFTACRSAAGTPKKWPAAGRSGLFRNWSASLPASKLWNPSFIPTCSSCRAARPNF